MTRGNTVTKEPTMLRTPQKIPASVSLDWSMSMSTED